MQVGRRWSWLVALACIAVAVGLAAPAILDCPAGHISRATCQWSFNRLGSTSDWRYFGEAWEAARVSLSDFHQFPSWNPYHCGGLVLYQDPQSPFPGPIFLLTFWWLPAGGGVKGWVLSPFIAGAPGARALVPDRGGHGARQPLGGGVIPARRLVSRGHRGRAGRARADPRSRRQRRRAAAGRGHHRRLRLRRLAHRRRPPVVHAVPVLSDDLVGVSPLAGRRALGGADRGAVRARLLRGR